jgi:aminoglycoside phosphotransferase (APT) family kinase protein
MSEPRIDPFELLDLLGISHPSTVSPVAEGWGDTSLWRVQHDGHDSLLRVYRANLRHIRDRELAAMRAICSVPIPRIEAVGEPLGYPTMLLSWCQGTSLLDALLAAPGETWTMGVAFGRAQAQIHAAAVTDTLREQVPNEWIEWGTESGSPLDRCLRDIPIYRESILHLDYHPWNVMFDRESVSCVIDWANVRIGDVRADFARTYSLLRWVPLPVQMNSEPGQDARTVFRRGWASGYRELAGPLPNLAPFLTWAAAVLERDLGRKIGLPGFWLNASDIRTMHRQQVRWRKRARIAVVN